MNTVACLLYGFEKVVELFLPAHEQRHAVVVGKVDTLGLQLFHDKRVTALCKRPCAAEE